MPVLKVTAKSGVQIFWIHQISQLATVYLNGLARKLTEVKHSPQLSAWFQTTLYSFVLIKQVISLLHQWI